MKNYWNNLTASNPKSDPEANQNSNSKDKSNSEENKPKTNEIVDERKGKVYEKYEDDMDPYRVLRD